MKIPLSTLLAKLCYFAQQHVSDPDAWGTNVGERESYFTCVDYQVSCFLSQHTHLGLDGVECNQVIDHLIGEHLTLAQWEEIIEKLVNDWGGEK